MKKPLLTLISLLLFLVLSCTNLFADDALLSTDITYKPTSTAGYYEVTLTAYKWCGSLPYCNENCNYSSCQQLISVTGDTGIVYPAYFYFWVTLVSVTQVDYKGGSCPSESTTSCTAMGCNASPGTSPGVEKYVFKGIVNIGITSGLPSNVCTIRFTYKMDRSPVYNSLNLNYNDSTSELYNYASINRCASLPLNNASPTYLNDPQFTHCSGNLFQNNHSAYDTDWQDSLSFSLAPTLSQYNTQSPYTVPYSPTFPFPATAVTCDPITGEVKFIPSIGSSSSDFKGAFVVETKQWRRINGVLTLMGVTRRDCDLSILASCGTNSAPYLVGDPVSVNAIGLNVLQYNICKNEPLCVTFTAKDDDFGDSTYLDWDSALTRYGATFTLDTSAGGREGSAQFCWTPVDSLARSLPYFFTVRVRDSRCPDNARVIFTVKVRVIGDPILSINTKQTNCNTLKLKYTKSNPEVDLSSPIWKIAIKPNDPTFAHGYVSYSASSTTTFSKAFYEGGMYYYQLYAPLGVPGFSTTYCPVIITDSFQIDSPPLRNASEITDATCFAANTGKIVLKATNGIPPYLFRFSPTANFTSTTVFNNVQQGKYYIGIRDFAECEIIDSITVSAPDRITLSHAVQHLLCYNDSSGAIHTVAAGGVSPYIFSLNSTVASSPDFEHLKAGKYIITVQDSNSCILQDSVWVFQNSRIQITPNYVPHPCNGTGVLHINPTGGASDYTFSFDQSSYHAANSFEVPHSGYIHVSVKDGNDCIRQDSVFTQLPDSFAATLTHEEISCFNAKDGEVHLTATGGISGNYTYRIENNDSNTTGLFTQLDAGTHHFFVRDGNNCMLSFTQQLTNPDEIVLGEMTGDSTPNKGSTQTYSITAQPQVQYAWTVTNGTIVSGQGSASITVLWSTMGTGRVEVSGTLTDSCNSQTSKTVTIGNVGLQEEAAFSLIHFYPNPTHNSVTIEAPGIHHQTVEVFDMHGKLLLSQPATERMEINLSEFAAGIYLMKIGSWKGKLVKEN